MSDTAAGHVEATVEPDATEPVTGAAGPDEPASVETSDSPGATGLGTDDEAIAETSDPSVGVDAEPGSPGGPTDDGEPAADAEPAVDAEGADTGPGAGAPLGDFSMALVSAVTMDLPTQHPTVVLRELESPRRQLSFSVGLQDGTVLSHAMRRIPTPRPLTHELMSGILQGFDIDVVAVRLVGRQGAVYFAELDLRGRSRRSVLACRPSDGLTIALLQPVPVPILIDRRLFEQVGDVDPAPGPPSAD